MTVDVAEHLRRGDLDGASALLRAAVRTAPAHPQPRAVLAQLMMVDGQWERATKQLAVLASLDPTFLPMTQLYRAAISGERTRAEVFAGQRAPVILGEPPAWIALFIQALTAGAEAGAALREAGRDGAPAVPGSADGKPFEWLADADPRLGPVFEMLIDGSYYWVPVERVRRLRLEAPKLLRDLVWAQAEVTWVNGGESRALLPVRYPGSECDRDPAIRLARATRWGAESTVGEPQGAGQRVLVTSGEELGMLGVRELLFEGGNDVRPEPA